MRRVNHVLHILPMRQPSQLRMRRRTIIRFSRVFLAYVIIVFILENVQLFVRYNDSFPYSQFHFPGIGGNYSEMEENVQVRNCTVGKENCAEEEDEEHPPVKEVDPTVSGGTGTPYVFQSLPIDAQEKAYYRFSKERIHPFYYEYLINGSGICNDDTTIISVINSKPSNVGRRQTIRETWGRLATGGKWPHNRTVRGNFKLVFMFGTEKRWHEKLLKENEQHGDIVQGDFIDSYRNMTIKTLLGMRWVVDFCPGVLQYLKSDDDMVINVPYLLDIFASRPKLRRTIMGPLATGSNVHRKGKWGLDSKIYPFKRYPPYEPGAAYCMTADLVGELFQAAEYFPHIFIDDVFITGILGRALGVNHARQSGFAFWGTRSPTGCDILRDTVITGHHCYEKRLRIVWAEMHRETKQSCLKRKPPPDPRKPLRVQRGKIKGGTNAMNSKMKDNVPKGPVILEGEIQGTAKKLDPKDIRQKYKISQMENVTHWNGTT